VSNEVARLIPKVTPGMSDKEAREATAAGLRKLGDDSPELLKFLREAVAADEQGISFYRIFKYRILDGAVAFNRVMNEMFGTQGQGVVRETFFGDEPPEIQVVETGIGQHTEAPFGLVKFPAYEATFDIGYGRDPELGQVSKITCYAPKRRQAEIEEFFDAVQAQLENNSIYRGKAITAAAVPTFFDISSVQPEQVIYAESVRKELSANVWATIRHSQRLRDAGMAIKRSVLLNGRYGTGKTLALVLTAQVAVQHGWTFVIVRSGDNALDALQTARMYAPAVVGIEDFDLLTADKDREEIDEVLDALDSASTKGNEVMGLFTTNFVKAVDMAALRPGRIDHIITFEKLADDEYVQLLHALIPTAQLAADVNYELVANSLSGLYPAFAKEAVHKAMLYNLDRNDWDSDKPSLITTEDIMAAAASAQAQQMIMESAQEAERRHPSIDDLLTDKVEEVMSRVEYMGVRLTVLDE
jgi:transitional endoplasmic reticulum ATPase